MHHGLDLLKLKEKIEKSKQERALLEGRMKQLLISLKEMVGTTDVKKARKKLEKMERVLSREERELSEGIKNLKQKYEW